MQRPPQACEAVRITGGKGNSNKYGRGVGSIPDGQGHTWGIVQLGSIAAASQDTITRVLILFRQYCLGGFFNFGQVSFPLVRDSPSLGQFSVQPHSPVGIRVIVLADHLVVVINSALILCNCRD